MTKQNIAEQYLEFLSMGNLEGITSLFSTNGMVHSPVYGKMRADQFYKSLAKDTTNSELKLKEIFENTITGNIALYFDYKWTLKTGKVVEFDVVDIIKFDNRNKIIELKIIYDTVISRRLVDEMK